MYSSHVTRWCATALLVVGAAVSLNQSAFAKPSPADAQEGVEVLTRGPVHEAFAGIVSFNPEAGAVATKAPPELIKELPPDQRPAGANVAWIPGYWSWDDERTDYLWVSGIWRSLPPGRQWLPGYWTKTEAGFQWISGFWADEQATNVEYLPQQPPETIEEGPQGDPPSPEYVWVPGTWVWYQGSYAWRPGHWVASQANWMWIPASYVWSPRGCVFVDGYWDYSISRRGMLFAPVYFNEGAYGQPGFSYSPAIAINLAVFGNNLFLRPSYGHYYFGDYYAAGYQTAGFYPWFSYNSQFHSGYDPIFVSQSWQNRENGGWEGNLQSQFDTRRENEAARPPRTLGAQNELRTSGGKSQESLLIAAPLAQLAKFKDSGIRLQPVSKQEQREIAQSGQKVREFGNERQKLETQAEGKPDAGASRESGPARLKLSKSPIVSKAGENPGKDEAPPETPKVPKPDPSIELRPAGTGDTDPKSKGEGERKTKKGDPRPEASDGEPKSKSVLPPSGSPKGQSETKKGEPQAETPKGELKPKKFTPPSESPKAEPKTTKEEPRSVPPKAAPPRSEPKERPKVEPKTEPPRAAPPKVEPKEKPKAEPRSEPPKAAPPRVEPKGTPQVEPKSGPPKADPGAKPKKQKSSI